MSFTMDDIEEAVKDGDGLYCGENVVCPYCGYKFDCYGYEDFPEYYEEGEHDIDCPNCEKTFEVSTEVAFLHETFRKEKE